MQYAIQTRDYNNDYLWSWEARGRDNPLAQVSLELLHLIQDGEKGLAVVLKSGTYHVLLSAIDMLGSEPIGKDFSGASIRLNLVFTDISQEQANGLVRYYNANRANPGIEFKGIATWDTNSWTINENVLYEAFKRIPEKKLICQGENEKLVDLYDCVMSDKTEGVKIVIQGDTTKIAVAPVPKSLPEVVPQTKDTGKKAWFIFSNFVIILVIVFLVAYVEWVLVKRVYIAPLQTKCKNLENQLDNSKIGAEDNSSNAGRNSELEKELIKYQNIEVQAKKNADRNSELEKELIKYQNIEAQAKKNADRNSELEKELIKYQNIEAQAKKIADRNRELEKENEELEKCQDIVAKIITIPLGAGKTIDISGLDFSKYNFSKIDPKFDVRKMWKKSILTRWDSTEDTEK